LLGLLIGRMMLCSIGGGEGLDRLHVANTMHIYSGLLQWETVCMKGRLSLALIVLLVQRVRSARKQKDNDTEIK